MFDSDKKNKLKKHRQVMEKLFQRLTSFEEYNQGIAKKGQPLSILQVPSKPAGSIKDVPNSIEEEAIAEKMKQKMSQVKITKKQLQAKAKEIKSKGMPSMAKKVGGAATLVFDEEEQADGLGGLFGDDEPLQAASEKKGAADAEGGKKVEKPLSAINPNECKILGFILLTKPASLNVMDPVTVGCIFFNGSTKKYFLRVIKLTFSINYLQNFISIDTNSGRLINKINGKQLLTIDDIQTQNLEILNHQETIFDLNTVFMRT